MARLEPALPRDAVDPHHPALQVDQGAAGVAGMDRGAGQQEPVHRQVSPAARLWAVDRAVAAADDPAGRRVLLPQGVAHGGDEEPHRRRAVRREGGRIVGEPLLDLQDRQEVERIDADALRPPPLPVSRLDGDLVLWGDDLRGADDMIMVQDHPGTQGDLPRLGRGGVDVHHRRAHPVERRNQGRGKRVHAHTPHLSNVATLTCHFTYDCHAISTLVGRPEQTGPVRNVSSFGYSRKRSGHR